jgi:hypothetical protein
MGVNVAPEFLKLAYIFLNHKIGLVTFHYLGFLVGANPPRLPTWEPIIESLRKRLGMWDNKCEFS